MSHTTNPCPASTWGEETGDAINLSYGYISQGLERDWHHYALQVTVDIKVPLLKG